MPQFSAIHSSPFRQAQCPHGERLVKKARNDGIMSSLSHHAFKVYLLLVSCLLCCCETTQSDISTTSSQWNTPQFSHATYNASPSTPTATTYTDSYRTDSYSPPSEGVYTSETEVEQQKPTTLVRDPLIGIMKYGQTVQNKIDILDAEIKALLRERDRLEKEFNHNALELQRIDAEVQNKRAERDRLYSSQFQSSQ